MFHSPKTELKVEVKQPRASLSSLPLSSLCGGFLLLAIILGPGFSLGPLRGFVIGIGALLALLLIYLLKNPRVPKYYINTIVFFVLSSGLVVSWHIYNNVLSARYFIYFYYYIFTFILFISCFWLLKKIKRSKIINLITYFVFMSLCLSLVELTLGFSFFNAFPLVFGEFQVGSGFWANKNNSVVALLIMTTLVYLSGYHHRFYLLTFVLLFLALVLDAKIGFLMVISQAFLFLLVSNVKVRIAFVTLLCIVIPVVLVVFEHELYVATVAFQKAFELLADPVTVQRLAETGEMFSGAIRVYAIQKMISMLTLFNIGDWLFGAGFGTINISFNNINWGAAAEYFSPHFFYLEILIYAGLMYYIIYFFSIRLLAGRFPFKMILLLSPCFASIVAVSSAVYFPPYYLMLAIIAAVHREQLESENA